LLVGVAAIGVADVALAADKIGGKGGNIGIGATLGNPTGFSFKAYFARRHAIQLDAGWAPFHHGDGRVNVDYLFHGTFTGNSTVDLLGYFGGGSASPSGPTAPCRSTSTRGPTMARAAAPRCSCAFRSGSR
jgi:hypothetical protein